MRDLGKELRQDKKSVHDHYSASLMSNAKWRRLFSSLEVAGRDIEHMIVKFVGVDDGKLIRRFSLHPSDPFVATSEFGPVPLVGIEWIEFPKVAVLPRSDNVPSKLVPQDLDAIHTAIAATGKQFQIEMTERGLRIIAHIR